jgi:hypothetical protein
MPIPGTNTSPESNDCGITPARKHAGPSVNGPIEKENVARLSQPLRNARFKL